ncbi:stage V sporulation protein S [Clostridium sp. SHJSY1]|uniref:stage V sporulation protein S n=1 Tax=Clostridium sp. SHJSY1 TaxID=2942483 RepID=UPI0028740D32|nr:stage V sporulation protein S [Clostridium sp. SHJSY1]MDS0527599.1 stage V sporulation protein S [Clostridium sp. SHJSY1]
MHNKNIKEVKVATKTDPKLLATSIIYSLKEGKHIKLIAFGQAVMVLTKAVCMVNLFKDDTITIDFQPSMQYVTGSDLSIHNAVVFNISIKE